jgi:hypothetical protein
LVADNATASDKGNRPVNIETAIETSVSNRLRPIVMLVAAVSICVATLLIATASFGASPINSMEVASLT